MIDGEKIFPVLLRVPPGERELRMRAKVVSLSRLARRALSHSAAKSGVRLAALEKDAAGAPLPSNGFYWSVTHKTQFVGGVVSDAPVGIDIERLVPRTGSLHRKIADDGEWDLAGDDRLTAFYRFWTAKEAVLKAVGRGLGGLDQCRVQRLVGERELLLTYGRRIWRLEHFYFSGHIATVVKNRPLVEWTLAEAGSLP